MIPKYYSKIIKYDSFQQTSMKESYIYEVFKHFVYE